MVVCKFFQQGNCRYGQSCRFEHIYGSKYSYHAPAQAPAQVPVVTDEQLVNQVQSDVQAALNGGQWILSCYAPFKEKPIIPGLSDLSQEEARLFIYEAKANNNIEAAVSHINTQMQETRSKYQQLLQPTASLIKALRSLYNGESIQSPFTTQTQHQSFGAASAATSIFRGAVQSSGFGQTTNASNSIFGQTAPNVFSNQNQNTSIFGSQPDAAKSIFASANQNVFAPSQPTNVFQTATQDPAKSIFSQATQSVFGATQPTNQPPSNVFGLSQNTFGQTDVFKQNVTDVFAVPTQTSVFQISDKPTTNVFGTVTPVQSSNLNEDAIYSKMEDLSQSDIEAYESSSFKLGFVPELPPSASLCR